MKTKSSRLLIMGWLILGGSLATAATFAGLGVVVIHDRRLDAARHSLVMDSLRGLDFKLDKILRRMPAPVGATLPDDVIQEVLDSVSRIQ